VTGYEWLGEIGRGGVIVRLSPRRSRTDRLVVLRILLTRPSAGGDWQRLFEDARVLAGLDRPLVVPLFAVGQEAGLPWFTLTLAEGSLSRPLLDQAPASCEAALLDLLARAVQEAHQRGAGERSLVPARVVLESGMLPFVPGLERTGGEAPIGQPAEGDRETMGMIVAACAGKGRLFPVDPPPDVDFEGVALKCSSRDPGRHHASAGELAGELERWLRGEEVEVAWRGPWRWS
jgi:serine/threonine-protein kinase